MAEGDTAIYSAFERGLLIAFYLSQPQLIAVVDHPAGRPDLASLFVGHQEVQGIVRRIRSLSLG